METTSWTTKVRPLKRGWRWTRLEGGRKATGVAKTEALAWQAAGVSLR